LHTHIFEVQQHAAHVVIEGKPVVVVDINFGPDALQAFADHSFELIDYRAIPESGR
jgi:hypothetical protein